MASSPFDVILHCVRTRPHYSTFVLSLPGPFLPNCHPVWRPHQWTFINIEDSHSGAWPRCLPSSTVPFRHWLPSAPPNYSPEPHSLRSWDRRTRPVRRDNLEVSWPGPVPPTRGCPSAILRFPGQGA